MWLAYDFIEFTQVDLLVFIQMHVAATLACCVC